MKTKRIAALLLLLCLLGGIAACGTPEPTEPATNPPTTTVRPTVPTTNVPTTTTPQPAFQLTLGSNKTTLPPDPDMQCPLLTFSLDPNALTDEYMARLILEAEYLLSEFDTFRLNNYFGTEHYVKSAMGRNMKGGIWQTPMDDCVTLDVGPYRAENFSSSKLNEIGGIYRFEFFEEDPGYIIIKSSDHPVRRYFQRYLVLLVMIYEKYADCLIDFDYYYYVAIGRDGPSSFTHNINICTDFRDSNFDSMLDFYTHMRLNHDFDTGFSLYYSGPNISSGSGSENYYAKILESLGYESYWYESYH